MAGVDQGRFGSAWGRYPDGAPGAVLVRDKVFDAFVQGPEDMIELFHGYTYSAHPLAIAAAVATLDAFKQDGVLEHVNRIIPIWRKHAVALKGAKNIVDVRTAGILGAVVLPASVARHVRAFALKTACSCAHPAT